MSDIGKNEECICGVTCEVDTCVHNNCQCGCTATNIKVSPCGSGSATNDTVCKSYQKQSN